MISHRTVTLVLAVLTSFSAAGCGFTSGDENCRDSDGDGWWTDCHSYFARKGPDCNDKDPNNWTKCKTCVDTEGDGWYTDCDAYTTISGPDCDNSDINNWKSCSTCTDGDGDGWYSGCDSYVTIVGPDCYESEDKDHCLFLNNDSGPYQASLGLSGMTAEESYAYPGVSATRVNNQITIESPATTAGGDTIEFDLCNHPGPRIERLWMTVKAKGDVDTLTKPDNYNAAQEMVFAIGPLDAGECRHATLSTDPWGGSNFAFAVRFLKIGERVSFLSDLADPAALAYTMEMYSMTPAAQDLFRHTYSAKSVLSQSWSPAAEWVGYTLLTQDLCGATVTYPSRVYIMHPDGANLTLISGGIFNAASPTFNPTGKLVAYSCTSSCHDDNSYICLYSMETGENKILYRGDGFYRDKVFIPKWSPDGKYITVIADGPETLSNAYTLAFGEVDPLTGDSISSLKIAIRGQYSERLPPDNAYYQVIPWYFNWGPDSIHGAMFCYRYRWNGTSWDPPYKGVAVFDMAAVINSPTLPVVPILTTIPGPYLRYPSISPNADRIYVDQTVTGGAVNILYLNLNNYVPATAKISFHSDGNFNRVPACFPPILDSFYAGRP